MSTRIRPIQTSFNAGEFSPVAQTNVGNQQRANGLALCENMVPAKQGGIRRRGSARYLYSTVAAAARATLSEDLVPFYPGDLMSVSSSSGLIPSFTLNFVLLNGIGSAAIPITNITNGATTTISYSGPDLLAVDDVVLFSSLFEYPGFHNMTARVATVDTVGNTFTLQAVDTTGYPAFVAGSARVFKLPRGTLTSASPTFASSGVTARDIRYTQIGDTVFMVGATFQPISVVRGLNAGLTTVTPTILEQVDGPYNDINTTSTTLTVSAATGSVTVTASSTTGINNGAGFSANDVGKSIRMKQSGQTWSWGVITAFISTTQVTMLVKGPSFGGTAATPLWRISVRLTGCAAVLFYQNRICFIGPEENPDSYYLTEANGYSPTQLFFSPTALDVAGTVSGSNAIYGPLSGGLITKIQWAAEDSRGILVGTTSGEWVIQSKTTDIFLTPDNHITVPASNIGGSRVTPGKSGVFTYFVDSDGKKIYKSTYKFEYDRILPDEVGRYTENIALGRIQSVTVTRNSARTVIAALDSTSAADGEFLSALAYLTIPEENVDAVYRVTIGQNGTSVPIADSYSLETSDGSLLLYRAGNNPISYKDAVLQQEPPSDILSLDLSVTIQFATAPVQPAAIGGLAHLEGRTVTITNGTYILGTAVVTKGVVPFPAASTGFVYSTSASFTIGVVSPWRIKTLPLAFPLADGVSMGRIGQISSVRLRVRNSLGLKYGSTQSALNTYSFYKTMDYYSITNQPVLYSGDTEDLFVPSDPDATQQLLLYGDTPYPFTLLAIFGISAIWET